MDRTPICPVCGEECDTLYQDEEGNIKGCDQCIHEVDAWEWLQEEIEEEERIRGDYEFEYQREMRLIG